jgi:hypothetical protein
MCSLCVCWGAGGLPGRHVFFFGGGRGGGLPESYATSLHVPNAHLPILHMSMHVARDTHTARQTAAHLHSLLLHGLSCGQARQQPGAT